MNNCLQVHSRKRGMIMKSFLWNKYKEDLVRNM